MKRILLLLAALGTLTVRVQAQYGERPYTKEDILSSLEIIFQRPEAQLIFEPDVYQRRNLVVSLPNQGIRFTPQRKILDQIYPSDLTYIHPQLCLEMLSERCDRQREVLQQRYLGTNFQYDEVEDALLISLTTPFEQSPQRAVLINIEAKMVKYENDWEVEIFNVQQQPTQPTLPTSSLIIANSQG